MSKKVLVLMLGMLLLASPLLAAHLDDDDQWRFNVDYLRYRFDWEVGSDFYGTPEDTQEYFDDDFDTTWTFTKGDIEMYFELEIADGNLGNDSDPQGSWADTLGAYGAKWMPESMADNEFTLQVGDFGTSFGKLINNDDSPHGSIGASWKMGDVAMVLEYGRRYEGAENDDVDGDKHLIRGQFHMPVGENFTVGAYGAFYMGSDASFEVEGSSATGDHSIFLGAFEMSGSVGAASVYSEVGFAAGTDDQLTQATDAAGNVTESITEIDLSGFYAMGGAEYEVGQVTLGVEAGFSPGDDDANDDKDEGFTAINSDFWVGEIMHDQDMIARTNGSTGGISNLLYAQMKADMSPTEKMSLSGGVIYLKPVEEITSQFTGKTADTYGVELFGGVSYKLSDNLKYNFYWGYAIPDEDFVDDNMYQVVNRLEFKF